MTYVTNAYEAGRNASRRSQTFFIPDCIKNPDDRFLWSRGWKDAKNRLPNLFYISRGIETYVCKKMRQGADVHIVFDKEKEKLCCFDRYYQFADEHRFTTIGKLSGKYSTVKIQLLIRNHLIDSATIH